MSDSVEKKDPQDDEDVPKEGKEDTAKDKKAEPADPLSEAYEHAISECGVGAYQWLLMFLLALGIAGDTIEVLLIAYILPSAERDLCMTDVHKGWLGAIVLIGMLVGSFVWGNLGDRVGRKRTLQLALFINAILATFSAFMPNYWSFMLCRFLSGVGIGGSIPIVFPYFSEFLPRASRGKYISFLLACFPAGALYTAFMAWLIGADSTTSFGTAFDFRNWRLLLLIGAIPAVISAAGMSIIDESPRFLLQKGKRDSAVAALQKIYRWNKRTQEVPGLKIPEVAKSDGAETDERIGLVQLFTAEGMCRITSTLMVIWWSLMFSFYGLSIWFPEYIKRLQEEQLEKSTNKTRLNEDYHGNPKLFPAEQPCELQFKSHDVLHEVFWESMICQFTVLPGVLIAACLMDKVGRRIIIIVGMFVSATSVMFIWLLDSILAVLIFQSVFNLLISITWNAVDILTAEVYPVGLRTTGFGLHTTFGRTGAIFATIMFGKMIGFHKTLPMIVTGAMLFIGGVASFALKESKYILH